MQSWGWLLKQLNDKNKQKVYQNKVHMWRKREGVRVNKNNSEAIVGFCEADSWLLFSLTFYYNVSQWQTLWLDPWGIIILFYVQGSPNNIPRLGSEAWELHTFKGNRCLNATWDISYLHKRWKVVILWSLQPFTNASQYAATVVAIMGVLIGGCNETIFTHM